MKHNRNPHENGHQTTHTMSPDRLDRLKDVLAIPSYSRNEGRATQYIIDFCEKYAFEHFVDDLGSVFITKGELSEGQKYPLIGAHIDTVHRITNKTIKEHNNILTAWDDDNIQVGIGGDDLAGVAICLELLLIMPVLKVGLFVSEEIGCVGSTNAVVKNRNFFENVGYMVEFDGPEDYMVTRVCSGVKLFDKTGDFMTKSFPLLYESMGDKLTFFNHPYTDVSVIKHNFLFSCVNISAGYFNFHSATEYVVISEVEKAIVLGEKMINELGLINYDYDPSECVTDNSDLQTLWG